MNPLTHIPKNLFPICLIRKTVFIIVDTLMTVFLSLSWLWTLMILCLTHCYHQWRYLKDNRQIFYDQCITKFSNLSNNSCHTWFALWWCFSECTEIVLLLSAGLTLKCLVTQTLITCCCRGNAELIKNILWLYTKLQGLAVEQKMRLRMFSKNSLLPVCFF